MVKTTVYFLQCKSHYAYMLTVLYLQAMTSDSSISYLIAIPYRIYSIYQKYIDISQGGGDIFPRIVKSIEYKQSL